MAAINTEVASRHEATRVTEEEHSSTAVFPGQAEPAQHVLLGPGALPIGEILEEILKHSREDIPWR